jgi:hypothetical protein
VQTAAQEAAAVFGNADYAVEARVRSLVVTTANGEWYSHKTDPSEDAMFGVLAVELPVQGGHSGGRISVLHGTETSEYDWSYPKPDSTPARVQRQRTESQLTKQAKDAAAALQSGVSAAANTQELSADAKLLGRAKSLCSLLEQAKAHSASTNKIEKENQDMATQFRCVSFYADCKMKMSRVVSGTKVVLLYNLVRTSPGIAHRQPGAAASTRIDTAVQQWVLDPEGPSKFVLPLFGRQHKYYDLMCQRISFAGLERTDRDVVAALRANGKLSVNLVTFERFQKGPCYPRESFG